MADSRIVVFSSLFPNSLQPNAGLFIRERMFRVGREIPIVVVSPVPWFPFQSLIRRFKPGYRLLPPLIEVQQEVTVYHPRFFSMPYFFRSLDGFFMALGSVNLLKKLKKQFAFNLIDAHFAYPDGYAATLLGRWFSVPVTITLRGTEVPLSKIPSRKNRMLKALASASRVFSVSDSLKQHVTLLGANGKKVKVVGNGVDLEKFSPVDQVDARGLLDISPDAEVLISVGGLVERKGFHRVIEVLPGLLKSHPKLIFLIVGGPSPEGNMRPQLEEQVAQLNLQNHVRFLGALPPEELKVPLSAASLFVLSTSNEGWANVFLEAMGCGLPVVTTNVGGNREVISRDELGTVVPFGDSAALSEAIDSALGNQWDREVILRYAAENSWDNRIEILKKEFQQLLAGSVAK